MSCFQSPLGGGDPLPLALFSGLLMSGGGPLSQALGGDLGLALGGDRPLGGDRGAWGRLGGELRPWPGLLYMGGSSFLYIGCFTV